MTQLAHDLALLRIPFDSWRLFDGGDPNYELWLHMVIGRVNTTNRINNEKAKKGAK